MKGLGDVLRFYLRSWLRPAEDTAVLSYHTNQI